MTGFLHSLAIAGARAVPSRTGVSMRRTAGKTAGDSQAARLAIQEPDAGPEHRMPEQSRLVSTARPSPLTPESALPVTDARAETPKSEVEEPIADRPAVVVVPPPRPQPKVEPRPPAAAREHPSRVAPALVSAAVRVAETPEAAADAKPGDILAAVRVAEPAEVAADAKSDVISAPVPLPRVPVLTAETLHERSPSVEDRDPPSRGSLGPSRFPGHPGAEVEAAAVRALKLRFDLPQIDGRNRMPTLDAPDRAATPVRAEPVAEPEIKTDARARATGQPVITPLTQPELGPVQHALLMRQASQAAGLTIHKLELQIVERPREFQPEPQQAATVIPLESPWGWPDRRYLSRVW
jgi:hypothetical protein